MFGRKPKQLPEQGRDRRQAAQGGATNPAFSYYTNRTPETTRERGVQPRLNPEQTGKGSRGLPRSFTSQLPFWLLLAIAIICVLKVLLVSTNAKVIVVGKSTTTANYLESTDVYAAAAQKLLAGSITNRTKLTVNLNGTAASLERQFPELQTVSLTVPLIGSRPIVYVQVAQPSLIVQSPHGNFALNKSGVVLAKLQTVPADVPLAVDQSDATPKPGTRFLPSSTVAFIQTLAYQLIAAKLTPSAFVLPAASPYELDVRLSGVPYAIRCNVQGDALTQSGAAIATIQHLGDVVPGSYIDVRVPDRVYYK